MRDLIVLAQRSSCLPLLIIVNPFTTVMLKIMLKASEMREKSLPVRADKSRVHEFRKDYVVTFLKSKSVIQKIRDFFSFCFWVHKHIFFPKIRSISSHSFFISMSRNKFKILEISWWDKNKNSEYFLRVIFGLLFTSSFKM